MCAEHALTMAKVTDKRCWNTIKVKRAWMRGEASDDELDAARYAAWVAARDAARDAADATWYAAQDAVWYAVWYAAWVAARDVKRHEG